MSYTFELENFKFSSNNPLKVDTVSRWFSEGGYTVEKIKKNIVLNRHAIMIDLTCWGSCNLAQEYWEAREMKQRIKTGYISNFKKGSVSEFWAQGVQGDKFASEKVFNITGWLL
jgi:uncharacterized protein (DUF1919 family)